MQIVKIDADGNVIPGQPVTGDRVRITSTGGTVIEQEYTAPEDLIVVPAPNNPDNPYFGKKPQLTKDFYALVGTVLGERYARLRNDSHFLWVKDVIDHVDIVNPDDKQGQFLLIVAYLTSENGDDGEKLMTAQECDTIMNAWP